MKKELITRLFAKGVAVVNKVISLETFKQYDKGMDADRTLAMLIEGMEELDTGFVFEGGQVRVIKKLRDKPTVSLWLTEDTFISLCKLELTILGAFWEARLHVDGEHFMRDLELFDMMFKALGAKFVAAVQAAETGANNARTPSG